MARGISRRRIHELSDRVVLRGTRPAFGVRRPRARNPAVGPGPLERAGLDGERALPRLRDLQHDDLREGPALLRAATLCRRRRCNAADPAYLLRAVSLEACR